MKLNKLANKPTQKKPINKKEHIYMNTKHYLSTVLGSIALAACFAIGVSTARGQVGYRVEDLGVVKNMEASEPSAINNQGHVAGTAYKGLETCAFHYTNKFMADAGGVNSRGFGISSKNMVVGDNFFSNPGPILASHAALFTGNEVAVDLGVLRGQVVSRANGINAMGQVVGFSGRERDSSESRAFMWTYQSGMIDIGTLGGPYAQAYTINEAGFITGTSQTGAMFVTTHAFIHQALSPTSGAMRDLGVLGGLSSCGMAINGKNHVAGYSTIKTNDERVHAFLHDGKSMIDLGSLGGKGTDRDVSVALGINNLDQVVGHSYLPGVGEMPLQQVAFLWRPNKAGGEMINLNKLLNTTARDYFLISATAINDNGQIVASALDIHNGGLHALLLTPMGPTLEGN